MTTDVDVIVIGSGAGGLAAAVPLAQAGLKVLVCEQHEVPGGWCHTFTLDGFRFSPGVHYIGGIQSGGSLKRIYEGLGVSQDLEFCEINPDGYDHIFLGEERFDIPKGLERFSERVKQRFPSESEGIDQYLNTIEDIIRKMKRIGALRTSTDLAEKPGQASTLVRWGLRTGQDLIEHFISDPLLRGILAGQSGDHGLPPSQVSAIIHAGIAHHYFRGGFYPRGGGFSIPRAFVRALKRAGGQLMLKTPIDQIILESGRAIGVRTADGTEISARCIISNADSEVTYGSLIGRDHLSRKLRRKLDRVTYSTSSLSLFLAVDMDLRASGLDSGNFWYYKNSDVDQIYRHGLTDHALEADEPEAIFLTATTLKDPTKMHNGLHTLEAFTFVSYDAFQKWAGQKTGGRSEDYRILKGQIAGKMLSALEKRVPGIQKNLVFCELGTPLSNEHYINATRGNLYGTEKSRSQIGPGAFPIKTEFDGLFMCGASTLSHGVAGATSSGLAAAKQILKCRTEDLLGQNGPEMRVYPSEHPSKWPLHLQRRIARGMEKKTGVE